MPHESSVLVVIRMMTMVALKLTLVTACLHLCVSRYTLLEL